MDHQEDCESSLAFPVRRRRYLAQGKSYRRLLHGIRLTDETVTVQTHSSTESPVAKPPAIASLHSCTTADLENLKNSSSWINSAHHYSTLSVTNISYLPICRQLMIDRQLFIIKARQWHYNAKYFLKVQCSRMRLRRRHSSAQVSFMAWSGTWHSSQCK